MTAVTLHLSILYSTIHVQRSGLQFTVNEEDGI